MKILSGSPAKILTGLAIAAVAGAAGGAGAAFFLTKNSPAPGPREEILTREISDLTAAADTILPAVFAIRAVPRPGENPADLPAGSAFFVKKNGTAVTARHVLDAAPGRDFEAILADGSTRPVAVVARDPAFDFAVIRVAGEDFFPVKIGRSAGLRPGAAVVAAGVPAGGAGPAVAAGVIAATGRGIFAEKSSGASGKFLGNLLQIDAAVGPGGSGGPVADAAGRVVGIFAATSGNGAAPGFATPIDAVAGALDAALRTGEIRRARLGVRGIFTEKSGENPAGFLLVGSPEIGDFAVAPRSPAAEAGLRRGDRIVAIDGEKISPEHGIAEILAEKKPGEKISVNFFRDGEIREAAAVLGEIKG